MKILFVSSLYPQEIREILYKNSHGILQMASDNFQWAVVAGLEENDVSYEVVSLPSLPAYPIRYKHLFTPTGDIIYKKKYIGRMESFCNLVVYKTSSIQLALKRYIRSWVERNYVNNEKLVILTYTPYHPYIKAVRDIKKKFPEIELVSIVTDLVDDMLNFKANRTLLKRIQTLYEQYTTKKMYKYIDKYVLLAKAMEEKIPCSKGKNIVVEGIFSNILDLKNVQKRFPHSLLYSGTFEEFSGIRFLLSAFEKTDNSDFRLLLCGDGVLRSYILDRASRDQRILYLGKLERNKVLQLQREVSVLINPRRPDGAITKYSFPSKTMEYLASGTPMIGYQLEGIPDEYFDYIISPKDLTVSSLTILFNEILSKSQESLDELGLKASLFIERNKNSRVQVKRIIDFI